MSATVWVIKKWKTKLAWKNKFHKPFLYKELQNIYCVKSGWSRYKNKSASKAIQWAIDYPDVSLPYKLINLLESTINKIRKIKPSILFILVLDITMMLQSIQRHTQNYMERK